MKVYIQTDIEGVAGFCFFEQRRRSEYEVIEHRHRMYRLLTAEVNAAVRAAFDAGADEVIVNDSHGSGYNILFEELDSRCRIIHGRNCSGPHWLPLLEGSDAMLLVGMHAMAGTPRNRKSHKKPEAITRYRLPQLPLTRQKSGSQHCHRGVIRRQATPFQALSL